jgi:thiamine-phosphate pyrophosphorylase
MKSFDISLYGILDPQHCNGRDLAELAAISVRNGVSILQYRDKVNETRFMIEEVRRIGKVINETGVALLVNDRVDVAMAAGADGVHLGQSDMHPADARKLMGENAIIGLSIKTIQDAKSAPVETIDYAFVGGVHATSSKTNPSAIGIAGWRERATILRTSNAKMPVGAIAGFTDANASEMISAGADGIAVISAIYEAEDVGDASSRLRQAIDAVRSARSKS